MRRGASHRIAAQLRIVAFLLAAAMFAGELVHAGHECWLHHVESEGEAARAAHDCAICEFEAMRPAETRPPPAQLTIALPPSLPLAPCLLEDPGPFGIRLVDPAAPRAPPLHV